MKKMNIQREVLNNIKQNYYECKGVLEPEPIYKKSLSLSMAVIAFLLVILEILYLAKQNRYIICGFSFLFVLFLVFSVINCITDKKLKKFYENKQEDMANICMMAIDDEAKKFNVSKEELVIYLLKNHRPTYMIRIITNLISIVATVWSVYYLPSFNQKEQGVCFFIFLVSINFFISCISSYLTKKIYQLDYFDFYVIRPFKLTFDKINKGEKLSINKK